MIAVELPAPAPRPDNLPTVLNGLFVVDFSRQIAGPYCATLLGDLGADVVKVEQPGRGDDARYLMPSQNAISSVFVTNNRNKRSIAIDLKSPAGIEIALDLIKKADVLIENFSHGVMERAGLGYEDLRERFPRLIYCSITAFGHNGKFADRPGFDPVAQADSGLFSLNGDTDRPPMRIAAPIIDTTSGLVAFGAVQSALLARHATGKGQRVEVALFDVGTTLTSYYTMNYLMTGKDQHRSGNTSQVAQPSTVYQTSDGDFFLSCSTDRMFRVLAEKVIERPDLLEMPEFKNNAARFANVEKLNRLLADIFIRKTRQQWIDLFLENGIPAGQIRSIGEAVHSPEMTDRGNLSAVAHPTIGLMPNIAAPFRLEGTPAVTPRPAPVIGEHTDQVLAELGYSRARIDELRQTKAIG